MYITYRTRTSLKHLALVTLLLIAFFAEQAMADRVKDLASVAGVRNNQLAGYGLVVGLSGTGDQTTQTPFTVQSIINMLTQFGITIPPGVSLQLKNVAAVTVHADLPAFAKPGQTIDVTVSSIGNAKSLRGGALLMAPMRGADGNVYALAQGNLVVGGFGASGNDGSSVTVNIPSAGRIPNGATVERAVPSDFLTSEAVVLNLHVPDFTTSNRLAEQINQTMGPGTAESLDAVSVRVRAPVDSSQRTAFVSALQSLEVKPGEVQARVIVNSRTGTVVIGDNVRVTPAAVSHGSLVVTISEKPFVSQPIAPFSDSGETVALPDSDVNIVQEEASMFLFEPGTSLDEIVRAVNRVGAAPGDLVAILEALKQAGALRAELVVI
ncbi:MAG: flagellar basal body P-ring protein FlgI [Gammaproteobacteria bacterium]|nr:flagellar basal body P-ring protein FlgI [Gammaproteobacteria bacterium]